MRARQYVVLGCLIATLGYYYFHSNTPSRPKSDPAELVSNNAKVKTISNGDPAIDDQDTSKRGLRSSEKFIPMTVNPEGGVGGSLDSLPTVQQRAIMKVSSLESSGVNRIYGYILGKMDLQNVDQDKLKASLVERELARDQILQGITGKMVEVRVKNPFPDLGEENVPLSSNQTLISRKDWTSKISAVTDPIDGDIKSLIGEENAVKFEVYVQTLPIRRSLVNQLQSQLATNNIPLLNDSQVDSLIESLYSSNPHWPFTDSYTDLSIQSSLALLKNTSSPSQYVVLEDSLERQKTYWAAVGAAVESARQNAN